MKKLKSVFILLLVVLIIAVSALLSYVGIGSNEHLGVANINLGLDLAGGVSITYQAAEGSNPTSSEMEGARAVIQRRLDTKGYTEASAYLDGTDRIRVEIPGIDDASEAVDEIGRTAMLSFVGIDYSSILSSGLVEEFYDDYVTLIKERMEQEGVQDQYTDEQIEADAESFFANYPADAIENFPQLLERAKEEGYAEVLLTGTNVANASYQKGQISENGMIEPYVRLEFDSEGQELLRKEQKNT